MSKGSRGQAAVKATISPALSPLPKAFEGRRGTFLAAGIVVLAAVAVYYNSFSGPFILDDWTAITKNSTIRHFETALSPPTNVGVGGRPLLNLTFALNYALGGMDVRGYHAFNLLIHALAGLTLFGIVRRTLREHSTFNIQRPTSKSNNRIFQGQSFRDDATLLALAMAVIWVVHPLQTEAVTYISQRAESLMGLFYLLTLYCFVRSTDETGGRQKAILLRQSDGGQGGERPEDITSTSGSQLSVLYSRLWLAASIFACLLGVMTKEIIVTAPVIVLLYDRTFIAGSFREAWRQHWLYYLGLGSTWLLLAHLMTGLDQRGVGFDQGVTWWDYALTSCRTVTLYIKLAAWPHPLVLDYGADITHRAIDALPFALNLAVLLAGTAITIWHRQAAGFLGAWVFLLLAPTTSIFPVAGQPIAEHRLYLPLAAIVTLAVLGLYRWIGRQSFIVFVAMAVGLGGLSVSRNKDYRSGLIIYGDTVAKCPGNARAHNNLGSELEKIPGRLPDAIYEYRTALLIKPDYALAHNNLGLALARIPGRSFEAMAHFQAAIQLKPDYADAHGNLGVALSKISGRLPEAISEYEVALRIEPDDWSTQYNLGIALARIRGKTFEAITHLKAALKINPDFQPAKDFLSKLQAVSPPATSPMR
jgi:tetratricopeptide (TPR) repeat protein